MTRYRWVAARKAEGFPTKPACDAAGVSRQAFYDWSARHKAGPSPRELADAELVGAIRAVHAESGGAYGSPRVTAQLRRQGRRANRKRVERLMRRNGICGIHKRRKPRLKGSGPSGSAPEDLVRRRFRPGRPDRAKSRSTRFDAVAAWAILRYFGRPDTPRSPARRISVSTVWRHTAMPRPRVNSA